MNAAEYGATIGNLVNLARLQQQLVYHEGKSPHNLCVIGFGRDLRRTGISVDEALHMLQNDIARSIQDLAPRIHTFQAMGEIRRRVLIDMVVNMGITQFMDHGGLVDALQNSDWEQASRAIIDLSWDVLACRVERLAEMMRSGEDVVLT